MRLKMLTTAMVTALLLMFVGNSAEAQGRGRHGGNGYNKGRHYAPRHAATRGYHGNNNCAPRYRRPVYRGNNCAPRYGRIVRPVVVPVVPRYNNCYGNRGYGNSVYVGGGGVSVNVNTPGFSGSFNSGNTGNYNRRYSRW